MMFPQLPFGRFSQHHYTRAVRTLRVALPVTAVLVLAIVVIWPHFDPAQAPKRHVAADAPEMHNSYYTGTDKSHEPFTITADKAVQRGGNGNNDMDMVKPLAEVTLKGGAWVAVSADQGQYREDPGVITLEGHVHLYHDQGYDVFTSAAGMDLTNGIAWSDKPTEIHGPRGDIWGSGFKLIQDSDKIIVTGNSRLILKPEEEQVAPAPDPAEGGGK